MTRSATTSAWSGGSAAISASASRVACASTAAPAGSSAAGRSGSWSWWQRAYRPPGGLPGGVDRAHPRHGEHPGPEAGLVAAEPVEAAADLEPHVSRGVLGGRRRDHSQIAQQRRVEVPPEHRERVLVAVAGIGKVAAEAGSDHDPPPVGRGRPGWPATHRARPAVRTGADRTGPSART